MVLVHGEADRALIEVGDTGAIAGVMARNLTLQVRADGRQDGEAPACAEAPCGGRPSVGHPPEADGRQADTPAARGASCR